MEVFLRNLPVDLTDRSLHTQLEPFMVQLSIRYYSCDKHKGKPFGHVTFLNTTDGKRFLERHGEVPLSHRKWKSRLTLLNTEVFCKLSNKQPAPGDLSLKSIEHEINQRESRHESAPDHPIEFAATPLSCGHHMFVDGKMTFFGEWSSHVTWLVKFTKRNLIISLPSSLMTDGYQIRIPFQSIIEFIWFQDGNVAITLSRVPTFLLMPNEIEAAMREFHLDRGGSNAAPKGQYTRMETLTQEHGQVSSFCLVYHFKATRPLSERHRREFYDNIQKLKQKDFFPMTQHNLEYQFQPALPFDKSLALLKKTLDQYKAKTSLPFDLLFQLQALVYNGYLHPTTVLQLAEELVALFAKTKRAGDHVPPISVDAFKKLFSWIGYPSPQGDMRQFQVDGILEYLMQVEEEMREGLVVRSELFNGTQNLTRIYRAHVTPTRITLHGPELEAKNRVLRKFPDHQDHFLRIQFSDEDGRDLFFNSRVSLEMIYDRFKVVLGSGIPIAGRIYSFLGFSHSSLRAHSLWLSAPFFYNGAFQLAQLIITGLGDFLKIQSPARRAARIGQAFSETPYELSLDDNEITVTRIPDIGRNGRVFSDGVGTISQGAMEAIHNLLPPSKQAQYPTCFQIRWAGAKGMLTLDTGLQGNQFSIRPSMEKFESDDQLKLEICDTASKPIPLVLNRQIVKILEDMGAPKQWFMELQDKELKRLRGITADVYNTASFLQLQSIGEAIQLPKFLRQADQMGIDYRRDSFLRAVVEVVVLKELRLLKHKARIPVRQGMTLFGVMDETGFLEEGEVYFSYNTMDGRHEEPHGSCPVLVTRSPALHPGDIQLANYVIPPKGHPLTELWNCIVFSQKGKRDLPSQLSGGDLDGDLFNVIWDPAITARVTTFPPADYERVEPLTLNRQIEAQDMADFFIDFMKTDHLGVIATRHMIMADQKNLGTRDADCQILAQFHSSAVDFSKTGQPVELSKLPKCGRWRPDFFAPGPSVVIHDKSEIEMDDYIRDDNDDDEDNEEGPRYKYYRSEKILGELYRAVDEKNIWAQDIKRTVPTGGASFWDELISTLRQRVSTIGEIRWTHRSEEAYRIRHAYDDAILAAMIDGSDSPIPLSELEVFVGFILNKTGAQTTRQRDRSVKLKEEFERVTGWITSQIRKPASPGGHTSELDALELCLACVDAGCVQKPRQISSWTRTAGQNIESFKIVAASALMRELNALGVPIQGNNGGYVGVSGRPATKRAH
ncbi:RNA dependent RNA polymerase-domain-containing protein [Podospora appendiculata]|uniref:RNA-dependent RNA polymerase n=1 Tax=Podospora appendiculata TaxID=314037 RepID=A0AAE0X3M5_9PEZI|nr:RNA dependent RNA polymerase-domain-containing protein [Podospora appendiculata]